jgi:hypothetical protein
VTKSLTQGHEARTRCSSQIPLTLKSWLLCCTGLFDLCVSQHPVTVTKQLRKSTIRRNILFGHKISVFGPLTLFFMGCGEAKHCGGMGIAEQSCSPHDSRTGSREGEGPGPSRSWPQWPTYLTRPRLPIASQAGSQTFSTWLRGTFQIQVITAPIFWLSFSTNQWFLFL